MAEGIFVFFVFTASLTITPTASTTPNNSIFISAVNCTSTEVFTNSGLDITCQASCSHHLGMPNCTQGLYAGCICKPQYIRGPSNACILPADCAATTSTAASTSCIANQTYDSRAPHQDCRPTCANPGGTPICPFGVYPGCVCQEFYYKMNGTNQCVLQTDCPRSRSRRDTDICGAYEVYDSRAPHPDCRPSCENPTGTTVCNKGIVAGCICNSTFLRYKVTNQCIPESSCPRNFYVSPFDSAYYYMLQLFPSYYK